MTMENVLAVVIEYQDVDGKMHVEWLMYGPEELAADTAARFDAMPFVKSVRLFPIAGEF